MKLKEVKVKPERLEEFKKYHNGWIFYTYVAQIKCPYCGKVNPFMFNVKKLEGEKWNADKITGVELKCNLCAETFFLNVNDMKEECPIGFGIPTEFSSRLFTWKIFI